MQFTFNEGHIQLPSQWQDQSMQVLVSTDNSGINLVINGHCGGTGHRRSADTAEVFNGLLKTFYGHTSPFQRRRLTAGGTPRPSQR